MGSHSGEITCPKCGNEDMASCEGYQDIPFTQGDCFECGYYFYTADGQYDLEELNETRKEQNESFGYEKDDEEYLHPLESLPNVKGGAL
jgi:hypothetical protein